MRSFNFLFSNFGQDESNLTSTCLRYASDTPAVCLRYLFRKVLIFGMLLFTLGVGNVWGATATFVPSSASAGTLSGAPDDASATFSNTYSSTTQMTSGNSQTLTLSGFDGCTITGLKCHMKANSSKGKGSVSITINGSSKGTLSISRPGDTWKDQTVPVTSTVVTSGKDIVVTISATENSLYCDSYTITYTAPSCDKSVTIGKGSETNGTFTLSKTGSQATCSGLSVDVTPTPSTHYHVASVTTTTPTTGGAPTITGPSAGKYTVAYAANSTGSSTINVAFEEDPQYTVTWVAGGNSSFHTQTNYAGTALTTPGTPAASTYCPGGKVFVGWTATEIVGTTNTQPADLFTSVSGMSIPATNKTYYAVFATESVDVGTVTDNLTRATTGIANNGGYSAWSNKIVTSDAKYAGKSAGGNNSIQLRTTNSDEGIITTSSGGKAKKITLTWNTGTTSGRTVDVYGKNTAYSSATDLYSTTVSTQGTKLGSIAYGTSTTLSITGDYAYIGLRSNSSALYLDNIAIDWSASTITYTAYATSCCTPLGSINGSVNWSSDTKATVSWDAAAGLSSWTLKYKLHSATDIPANWTSYDGEFSTTTGRTSNATAINGLTAGEEYDFLISGNSDGSTYCSGAFSETAMATVPKITLGSASGASTYIVGGGSGNKQTFTVTGVGLTGNLTVTAPTNFEVCTTENGTYTESITLSPTSGAVSSTVYFRLVSGLAVGSYGSSNITVSGGSAASVNVAVSGTVSPACESPTINTHPAGATYNLNTTATALSVSATKNGTGPALTYQWYSNTANSKTTPTPTIIVEATNASYTPPTTATGTKYYFCEVSSGACSITSNIAAVTVNTPSITVSRTSIAFGERAKGGTYTETFTVNGSTLANDVGLSLAVTGANATLFSINKSSIAQTTAGTVASTTVTVTYSPNAAGSHSATLTISSTGATDKTIALTGTGLWNVEWYVGGSDSGNKLTIGSQTTTVANGAKVTTLPAAEATNISCGGKTFVGWTAQVDGENKYVNETLAPSDLFTTAATSPTISGDTKFYAVFAEDGGDDYELVTSSSTALAAGDKIIIASSGEAGSAKAIGKQNVNGSSVQTNRTAVDVTIISGDNGPIIENPTLATATSNTTDIYPFILEANDGAFAIKEDMTSGRYLAATGGSSDNYLATSNELNTTTAKFTISVNEDDVASIVANVTTSGAKNTLKKNSSSALFSCYSSGQSAVYIYRKPGGSNYTTNCEACNEVTLAITSPTNATMTVKRNGKALANGATVQTCAEQTLKVKVAPDTHYRLTTMTISGGSVSVNPSTSTGLPSAEEIEYTVTIPADATGTVTINPTITATPTKTVQFLTNGESSGVSNQIVYVGEAPTMPAALAAGKACDVLYSTFYGWTKTSWTGTIVPSELRARTDDDEVFLPGVEGIVVTDSDPALITYNAVWADGTPTISYEKLASNSFSTTDLYVIGAQQSADNKTMYYLYSCTNTNSNNSWGYCTSSPATNTPIYFKLSGTAGELVVKSTENTARYLTPLTTGNFQLSSSSQIDSLTSSGEIYGGNESTYRLRYNHNGGSGGLRWYSNNTTGQPAYFYKVIFNDDAEYLTHCCTHYSITGASTSGTAVTGGTLTSNYNSACEGKEVKITADVSSGYRFDGWNITSGGAIVSRKAGSAETEDGKPVYIFTMPAAAVSVSATITRVYTVTYAKGPNVAVGDMSSHNNSYVAGATVTIADNEYTHCGYYFNGWNVTDAESSAVEVSDGTFTMPESNVTITAQWASYQDTYKDMMHTTYFRTESGNYTTKSNPNDSDTTPDSSEGCEGLHYHFMGWVAEEFINTDGTLQTDAEGFEIVPANKAGHCATGTTYYAVWAEEE